MLLLHFPFPLCDSLWSDAGRFHFEPAVGARAEGSPYGRPAAPVTNDIQIFLENDLSSLLRGATNYTATHMLLGNCPSGASRLGLVVTLCRHIVGQDHMQSTLKNKAAVTQHQCGLPPVT
jgi:hypothetical protein